jgi:hypothetical protein
MAKPMKRFTGTIPKLAEGLKLDKGSQKGRFCGETTKRGGTQIRTGAKASKTPKNAHKH